jgi:hypothetical protein
MKKHRIEEFAKVRGSMIEVDISDCSEIVQNAKRKNPNVIFKPLGDGTVIEFENRKELEEWEKKQTDTNKVSE